MLKKLIPANKDPRVLIKENDKYAWHVEQSTRDAVPGNDPTKVRTTTWIGIYDDKTYNMIFTQGRMGAAGLKEARVVHDPVLQRRIDNEKLANDDKAEKPKKAEVKDTGDDLGMAAAPKQHKRKE